MYELAHRKKPTATELSRALDLDPGYLSRILRAFQRQGLIERTPSPTDARQGLLSLTAKGRKAFAPLDRQANEDIAALLGKISPLRQQRLLGALATVEELLGPQNKEQSPYLLRSHRPGDMGWIVYRHGILYSQEYGWDERFEALVAGIAARFIENYDARREHCWIAERAGEILGAVMLVRHAETVAQLRLLLVEPSARGMGIGKRLVQECIAFARQARYRKITLWTNHVLHAARHIYEEFGFQIVRRERHHSFGHDLTAETWELKL
jgi:DNA-binding MarR family transcriptional regulator/GNAT superfamily N-acetyltransferase